MNENEKAKAVEKANSYREMCRLWAWKDLINSIDEIKKESVTRTDSYSTKDLSLVLIAEDRGIRKGLDRLLAEVDSILEYK